MSRDERHPSGLDDGHQRNRREVEQQPRRRHTGEDERADGKQCQFGRERRGEEAGRSPAGERRRAHAGQQERRAGEDGGGRAIGEPGAGVAHRERIQGERRPGRRADGVVRPCPVIDRVGRQIQHGHLRRAHHRGAAAHQARIAGKRGRHADVRHARPQAGQAGGGHQRRGEDRDVAARDRDHVVRAGLLQPLLRSPRPDPPDRRAGSR